MMDLANVTLLALQIAASMEMTRRQVAAILA